MEIIWHYLVNQFLNATVDNYKKALKLSNYHDAYLKKMMDDNPMQPDWATLYNRYHPFHLAFVDEYTKWKSAGGSQKGQTLNLDQLLNLLITKVNRWDAQVQLTSGFEKGTPNFLAIFPQGHKPFITGAKTTRVSTVKELGENMQPFALANPAIATVKAEVDAFYTILDDARDTQESAKGGTKQKSAEVENKRVVVMIEQYRDLGFLINKGAEVPSFIAPFFELNVLRGHNQVLFTGTLDAGENEPVLVHTFVTDDEITLEITSAAPLPVDAQVQFYLATTAGGTDSTAVTVTANETKITIQAVAFSITEYGTHRYLTAINNTSYELHYEVELI